MIRSCVVTEQDFDPQTRTAILTPLESLLNGKGLPASPTLTRWSERHGDQ